MMEYIHSYLKGGSWFTLGDSITERGWYQPIVAENLGLATWTNYGIGGTCIAQKNEHDNSAICLRYKTMGEDPDLITIWGGGNDFGFNFGSEGGTEIGDRNDKTSSTFYGAMDLLLTGVIKKYPLARVGFVVTTPVSIARGHGQKNAKGYYLTDYCNASREKCEEYSIPYLDLQKNSGFNEFNMDIMTSNTTGVISDGLHPSKLGMERLATKITHFILSL
ncbi:SGNH/GDSL hydrolase family protein [Kosakonia sacchari]|uniref:SGNH/GDSL hydrolase family protein n=1 Tax=Kosakonia sacchari TaxID=1158459 RepID=UPI000AEFE228|nr:SGNH/GDSL hydrolase family protein [Kosakonia sacchari]MDN2488333.1 SGNH/GDSL hydrolase family protein [Kosakonia sacchari]